MTSVGTPRHFWYAYYFFPSEEDGDLLVRVGDDSWWEDNSPTGNVEEAQQRLSILLATADYDSGCAIRLPGLQAPWSYRWDENVAAQSQLEIVFNGMPRGSYRYPGMTTAVA